MAISTTGYVLSGERHRALYWLCGCSRHATSAILSLLFSQNSSTGCSKKVLLSQTILLVSGLEKQFHGAKNEIQEYHIGHWPLSEIYLIRTTFRALALIPSSGEFFFISAHSYNLDFNLTRYERLVIGDKSSALFVGILYSPTVT
jgi:hypothetical protein